MAITKTIIYGTDKATAAQEMYNFLLENAVPTYFDSVVYDEETDYGTINCYVGELLFIKLSQFTTTSNGVRVTITTEYGQTQTVTISSAAHRFKYAYMCSSGIIFQSDNPTNEYFIICKNNNDETAIISPATSTGYMMSSITSNQYVNAGAYLVAYSTCDDTTFKYYVESSISKLTTLCPIPTNSTMGRYLKNVYYTPFNENITFGVVLNISGTKYISTGLLCIKD